MRILCLHGYGTSGAIMRSQMHAVISQADPSYEFVFLDGEYECPPAQGLGGSVDGPTLCFNKAFGPDEIQSSLDHLDDFIETEGPFDGILGFSQGGSLALSYLLRDAETKSLDFSQGHSSCSSPSPAASSTVSSHSTSPPRPSFKFAIFLSTIVAFSPRQEFALDLLTTLTTDDRTILHGFPYETEMRDYKSMSEPQERALFFDALGLVLDTSLSGGFIAPDTDLGLEAFTQSLAPKTEEAISCIPRIIHPSLLFPLHQVPIPTVHVIGRRDEPALVSLSRLMEKVCEPTLVRSLAHEGAHDVPRNPRDVRAFWAAVDWAVAEGLRLAW
ncbi:hypothetical protein A1O1_04522 [Capronia coronata CBS 617.96]|uniref:Serine hydrolase domain-containing protein n=1 Tax=Capronia coronata CBS 617.96 TaxID=1182541 RepID=W9YP35_9EURO|nr:uncharacterized protein A1O1_04522 [Capronia coronata CBS 617.96]EXJ91410.1 hypothetical protein A1O1_04522 [Capronia coronata CBS 617.96]